MPQLKAPAPMALNAGPDLEQLAEYYDDEQEDETPITGEVVIEDQNGNKTTYGIVESVSDLKAAQARAEFPEAETKFDTTQPTEAKPEDGGRKAFEDYCETRNLPEFKRFALLNSAGGDYVTAIEFAKKVK